MSRTRPVTASRIEVRKGSEVTAEAPSVLQAAVTLGLGPDRLHACHMPLSTAEPLWLSHLTH